MEERLQKLLSQWGIASRRQAENLISAGRVKVNGTLAHLGQRANPNIDTIEVDGTQLTATNQPRQHYLLLHKPRGVVSTCDDPQSRRTVIDLLPESLRQGTGIHPVGRLDTDSTGALLLTNNGQLTHQLTHPRYHIAKTYRVRVEGTPSQATLTRWRQGVQLDGQMTLPAAVTLIRTQQTAKGNASLLDIVLQEGRNRQIRRVAEALGHPVISLHRTAIGPITLGALPRGQVRPLSETEMQFLRTLSG